MARSPSIEKVEPPPVLIREIEAVYTGEIKPFGNGAHVVVSKKLSRYGQVFIVIPRDVRDKSNVESKDKNIRFYQRGNR